MAPLCDQSVKCSVKQTARGPRPMISLLIHLAEQKLYLRNSAPDRQKRKPLFSACLLHPVTLPSSIPSRPTRSRVHLKQLIAGSVSKPCARPDESKKKALPRTHCRHPKQQLYRRKETLLTQWRPSIYGPLGS